MAYQVVVSPLVGVVFDKLNSLIQNKFGEVRGVQKEMKKIFKTLSSLQDVLNDAEEKQVVDPGIHKWLNELKDATYKADDTLEEWAFRDKQLGPAKVIDSLKELMESFDELAEDMVKFHLQRGMVQKRPEICSDRETGALLTEPKVYGREKEEKELVKLLLDQCPPQHSHHPRGQRQSQDQVSSQEDIFICSILGMGGLGKTTLAQLVYNNGQVTYHFHIRAWVCVSDNFDVTRLIKLIIASVSKDPCNLEALAPLQQRLQDELRGKRFLLVLDDVWDSNQDKWNRLKVSLACGAKGSCVIVTTRLNTVASVAGTCLPYDLKILSNKACWRLFKQRAFGLENAKREPLEEIGKQIIAKCGGLPLAAKAMGGLLRFENKESQWLSIRDSEIWKLPQDGENDILPVLTLSYNHLSPVLKQCFAYCSLFPKDHDFNIKDLIHLWMANGLVLPKGNVDLEDAGDEIFRALLWRSMFQEVQKDEDENMLMCKMHDLVHDLACYMARNESYALNVENADAESAGNITKRTRHVSMFSQKMLPLAPGYIQTYSQGLRSLIRLGQISAAAYKSFIFGLTRLRALDLSRCNVEMVPNCIGEMIHLRYLNLSENAIKSLPECISGLQNVQTLILRYCRELQSLPKDTSQMINLRHLEIQGCHMLQRMPIDMGKLICLHTLSFFFVGLENGCSIKELQRLNHLEGKLEIKKLENVKNSVESKEANLRSKKNLQSLKLSWSKGVEEVQENVTEVIESLQPHSNLRRCFVRGYQGVTFPNWLMTVSAVPNLVEISLEGCRRCVRLPPLGKLPVLKTLKMYSMDSVKFIDGEVYGEGEGKGFPSLETLHLSTMPNLEDWSPSVQAATARQILLPRLKNLRLVDCPKLKGPVPLSSSLRSLYVNRCNEAILGYVRDLPCLSKLYIVEFDELVSFPEGALQNLTSLAELSITECKKLKALPLEVERLTTLKTLEIWNCGELISLGERNLSSLETLVIHDCPNLKRLPKFNKTCLDGLEIRDCPELELSTEEDLEEDLLLKYLELKKVPKLRGGFPVALKHATMLSILEILGCWSKEEENEMDLPEWIASLTSLQILKVEGCKNRRVLPEGLQNLTALIRLDIFGCNKELERRCDKDKGEDWFKITHVKHVNITSNPWNEIHSPVDTNDEISVQQETMQKKGRCLT